MVKITYTNIIVDQFSTARNNPFNKYVHFLTHIHTDHLKGLSNSWDCGTIYCSPLTKKLLLLKFPRLNCLKQLQLQKQHTIALSSQLEVTVTLFDSNHCPGGVMLLIQGYMGVVLYSGDMRFDKQIFGQYGYLYPHGKRNKNFTACSKQVDFLYLDITFLHPKFDFPKKSVALQQLDQFISGIIEKAKQQNKFIQFYIGMDNFGKQQVLVHLAQTFQTLVTVSQERYKNISTVGLQSDYFSTDPDAGFIHVVLKRQLKQYLAAKQNSMGIILTGWANQAHYRSARTYAIPYSLHSSYPELYAFVESIRPSMIQSILQGPSFDKSNKSQQQQSSKGQKNELSSLYQEVSYQQYLNKFRNQLTSKPSTQLSHLLSNIDFQKKIKEKLKLDRSSAQINRDEFGMTTTMIRVQNLNKAGVRLSGQRNQSQIQKVKQKLKNKQQLMRNRLSNQFNGRKPHKKPISFTRKSQEQKDFMPLEIQDNAQQQINKSFCQQKSNSSKNNSNSSTKDKEVDITIQQNSQATRKNKWKKKIDEGQIDLFGQVAVKSNKNNANNRFSTKNGLNQNSVRLSIPSIKNKLKSKRAIKDNRNNPIELLSDEEQQVSNRNDLIEYSDRNMQIQKQPQEANKDERQNQSQQSSKSNSNKQSSSRPSRNRQKQTNQRSITQFFSKKQSSKDNQLPIDGSQQNLNKNLKNKNGQTQNLNIQNDYLQPFKTIQPQTSNRKRQRPFSNDQKYSNQENGQQQEYSVQYYMRQQQNQFKNKKVIRNSKDCSLLMINFTHLDQIKQASIMHYQDFFKAKK